jgi:hypothetical protein
MQIGSLCCDCSFQRCFCVELSRKRGGNRFIRETHLILPPPSPGRHWPRLGRMPLRAWKSYMALSRGPKPPDGAAMSTKCGNSCATAFARILLRLTFAPNHAPNGLLGERLTVCNAGERHHSQPVNYLLPGVYHIRVPTLPASDGSQTIWRKTWILFLGGTACLTVADSFLSRRKTKEKTRALQSMSERLPWMCRYECGKWVGHPTRYASKAMHGLQ